MWGLFKSVSQTFTTYVYGAEQLQQEEKEKDNNNNNPGVTPAISIAKSVSGPETETSKTSLSVSPIRKKSFGTPADKEAALESDYKLLTDPVKLKIGFMLLPSRSDAPMGKIIFTLGDFLVVPIGIEYLSAAGSKVVRISKTQVSLANGAKIVDIPQEAVIDKETEINKLKKETEQDLNDFISKQPTPHIDPLGAMELSPSEIDQENKIKRELETIEKKRKEDELKEQQRKEEEARKEKERVEAEKLKKEKEEQLKKEQEEKQRKLEEDKKKKEQEEKLKKEQEQEKLKKEQEENTKKEQERIKKEQEEKAKKEQDEKKKVEEEKAKKEQEEKLKKEQEEKRKMEEEKLTKENEEKLKKEREENEKKKQEELRVNEEQKKLEEKPKEEKPVEVKEETQEEKRRRELQDKLAQEKREEDERKREMEEQRQRAERERETQIQQQQANSATSSPVTVKKLKTGEGCEVCGKRVYPMERFSIGEKAYHQQCFKCSHCNRPLTPGTYSSVDSGLYCKPHFLQLFKEKGTYNTLTSGTNTPSMTVNVPKSDPVPRAHPDTSEKAPSSEPTNRKFGTYSHHELNKMKEEAEASVDATEEELDSAAKYATVRRTKGTTNRRLPTRKSREDREKKEKKESTIYVIDEATLAQMEEPQSAPVTSNNNRPRKLNLQENLDLAGLDPKARKIEMERRLQEEEDRMRDEKEQLRREQEQQAFQSLLSPAIKRKTELLIEKILIHIKGKRRVRVRRVQLTSLSLNSGDVFLLDCYKKIYMWIGSSANRMEKAKALDVSQRMAKSTGARVITLNEKDEETKDYREFWEEIGGKPENIADAKSAGDDEEYEREVTSQYNLYKISNGQPMLLSGKLVQKMLETEHTYVLDSVHEVYSWIGKKSNKEDRHDAMEIASQLFQENQRPEWVLKETEVKRIVEGGETLLFREKFTDWPDALPISAQDTLSLQSNIAQVTKIEKYDVTKIFDFQKRTEEMPDDGSGDKTIWVVTGNTKEEITGDVTFYSKHCYIILYKYNYRTGPQGNYVKYVLYYWQGIDSSKADRGTSGLLATDVFKEINKNGGEVTLIRVLQNKENIHFKLSFKLKFVARKGDRTATPENTLFKIREPESLDFINAIEVPLVTHSLCSRYLYLLQTQTTIYLWQGLATTEQERQNIEKFIPHLQNDRNLVTINEGQETDEFWSIVPEGVTGKSYAKMMTSSHKPKLYCASEGTGVYDIDEVHFFAEEDLQSKYSFFLDLYESVYVWLGNHSSEIVKKMTMETALEYNRVCSERDGRPTTTPVYLVNQGKEPLSFACHFPCWYGPVVPDTEPLILAEEALKEYSREYTLEELIVTPPKFLDKTQLEKYLTEEEFEKAFGMSKEVFSSVPLWKAQELKKKIGLY